MAIRVDASRAMGVGHFMRCLTLADAAARRGVSVTVLSRQLLDYLQAMVRERGHEFVALERVPSDETTGDLRHTAWLGTSQDADAAETVDALSGRTWEWVIVDHYALDARWERALRVAAERIMTIDDLADRVHDCDLLLDQNLYADMETRYVGKVPARCDLLLGPRYALLRPEFGRWRDLAERRTGKIERLLIFFGGVDPHDYTSRAIEAVIGSGLDFQDVDVVIGPEHPHLEEIVSACAAHGFACHVQTDRMADLAVAADLAIGAGGSASWERCCVGLPTICISTAVNQAAIVVGLQARGVIMTVNSEPAAYAANVAEALRLLKSRPEHVLSMSKAACGLVDGLGAARVGARLVALSENRHLAV